MSDKPTLPSNTAVSADTFLKDLKQELGDLWQNIRFGLDTFGVTVRNQIRSARNIQFDYVVLGIGGPMPERDEPERSFIERQLPLPPPAFSMQDFNEIVQLIIDASNVKGVVIMLMGFSTGLATLQSIRQSIARLQAAGKEVVIYTYNLSLSDYFVATAGDRIIATPTTNFYLLGLQNSYTFLKDAFDQIGVQADVVQISPYKTAFDTLQHSTITPQMQEQIDWLLDDRYDTITATIAADRNKSQDDIKQIIDATPFSVKKALELGLIDDIGYEDDLPFLLAAEKSSISPSSSPSPETTAGPDTTTGITDDDASETAVPPTNTDDDTNADATTPPSKRPKAKLTKFSKAYPNLIEKARRHSSKAIGVISLEGSITMGGNSTPPLDLPLPFVGDVLAGYGTLVRTLRRAERNDHLAAVILHVDSPGGDAQASELIGREVQRIAQKKPVVIYMGNVAASGGYYASIYGHKIVCQPLTITGSIGVISMRISTRGINEKLHLNQVTTQRGENATLYSGNQPLTPAERQIIWDGIVENYTEFKQAVANGRSLPFDELDPICEGRVWTGRQALTHQLVDVHGDFETAVTLAADLADLPLDSDHDVPVVNLYHNDGSYILPKPFEAASAVAKLLSGDSLRQFTGRPLRLMPFRFPID